MSSGAIPTITQQPNDEMKLAKRAEKAKKSRKQCNRLTPEEKKERRVALMAKRKQQRKKEMAELEALLRESGDISDDYPMVEMDSSRVHDNRQTVQADDQCKEKDGPCKQRIENATQESSTEIIPMVRKELYAFLDSEGRNMMRIAMRAYRESEEWESAFKMLQ